MVAIVGHPNRWLYVFKNKISASIVSIGQCVCVCMCACGCDSMFYPFFQMNDLTVEKEYDPNNGPGKGGEHF